MKVPSLLKELNFPYSVELNAFRAIFLIKVVYNLFTSC